MSQESVEDAWQALPENGAKIDWLECSDKLEEDSASKVIVCALTFEGAHLHSDPQYLNNDNRGSKNKSEQYTRQSSRTAEKIGDVLRSFADPTQQQFDDKRMNDDNVRKNNSQEEENLLEKKQALRVALKELLTVQESVGQSCEVSARLSHDNLAALQEQAMSQDVIGAEGSLQHSGTSVGAAPAGRVQGDETEGAIPGSSAPSPASLFSTDFCSGPYTFQQFDCQSDCTESTTGFCATPMNTNINVADKTRVKSTSLDSAFSDFAVPPAAPAEPWESDTSIFNNSSGSNFFVLPSPAAEDNDNATELPAGVQESLLEVPTDSTGRNSGSSSSNSDSSTGSTETGIESSSSDNNNTSTSSGESESADVPANLSATSMPCGPPVAGALSTSASEDSPLEPGAALSTPITNQCSSDAAHDALSYRQTLEASKIKPTPETQLEPQEELHVSSDAGVREVLVQEIDLLVLPTALTDAARDCVYAVLSELGVHVKRVQSSAAALVTQYLTTAVAKQRLLQNSGYLRLMVIETPKGVVSASVVAVESPLQADLPSLNTNTLNTSTSTPSPSETDKAEYVLSNSSYDMVAPIVPAAALQVCRAASPGPALIPTAPIARSAVIRVESTVWSTCTEEAIPALADYVTISDSALSEQASAVQPAVNRGVQEGTTREVLLKCIQAAMEHQASLHSPYSQDEPPPQYAGAAAVYTRLLLQRKLSYHSVELDERLYGRAVAARLLQEENAQACAAMAGKEGVHEQSAAGAEFSIPVPVLDAVLLWPDLRHHRDQHSDQSSVLADLRDHLLPFLRDVVDAPIAAPAAVAKLQGEVRPLPLFTMPSPALLQGAALLQSLPCDAVRVFDCLYVRRCGASHPPAECAVGLVIRQSSGMDKVYELADDQVIWLHKLMDDGDAAAGEVASGLLRRDRGVSLLLRQDSTATVAAGTAEETGAQEALREVRIVAEPCTSSRRTCAFKPTRSVASLVQAPPPDTACLIVPTSATYLHQTGKAGTREVIGANLILASDKFHAMPAPSAGASGTASAKATAAAGSAVSHGVRGLLTVLFRWFAAVYEVLHYLIFPGTTYYIQYFQADVMVSPATQAATQAVHAAVAPSPAAATDANMQVTEPAGVKFAQWELLVVAKSTASAGAADQNTSRVLRAIPLLTAPTHCEELMTLEQGSASKTAGSRTKDSFPSCVVDLSAADNTGQRTLSIHVVNGAADVTSLPAPETKPAPAVFGRKRRVPPTEKKHFVALTERSYQLLRHRVRLQDRLRSVRSVLRWLFFFVLVVLIALHVAVLVEYAYMLSQPMRQAEPALGPSVPGGLSIPEVAVERAVMQDAWNASSTDCSMARELPHGAMHFCVDRLVDDAEHAPTSQMLPASVVEDSVGDAVDVADTLPVPQADVSVDGGGTSENPSDACQQDALLKDSGEVEVVAAPVVVVDIDNITVTVIEIAPPLFRLADPPVAFEAEVERRWVPEEQPDARPMTSLEEPSFAEQPLASEHAQEAPTPPELLLADSTPQLPTFPRLVSAKDSVRKAVHSLHQYYNRYLRRHHERLLQALDAATTTADREVRRGAKYVADSSVAQMLYAHAVLVSEYVTANVRYYAPIAYYALHFDKVHEGLLEVHLAVYPHLQAMCVYLEQTTRVLGERAKMNWISARQQVDRVVRDLHIAARSVGAKLSNTLAALHRGPEVVQQSTVLLYAGLQRGVQDAAAGVVRLLQAHKELWRDYVPVG